MGDRLRQYGHMPSDAAPTIVYIDGFNLYYGALKGTPHKWLNLEAFVDSLLPKNDVTKIRYFTARIKPREDDLTAPVRQQTYLKALDSLPRVETHFGQYMVTYPRMKVRDPEARPRTVQVIKSEEKGSDVNLATYLVRDAYLGEAEAFVVISNDSDLTEPLRLVKTEAKKTIGVVSPHPVPSRALLRCEPHFTKAIRRHNLENSQFSDTVTLTSGQTATKPDDWR